MPDFAWPWVFLALPLPWLVRWLVRAANPGLALRLPHAGFAWGNDDARSHSAASWWLFLGWLCLLVAAARPQFVMSPQAHQHSGRAMLLAIDLSDSMSTQDMRLGGQLLSRFDAVEAIAGDFISRRRGDELGLILFGTHAFLVTPLTYDLNAVHDQLLTAVVGLPGGNTALGDAIAVAVKRLAPLPEQARVLVLLTDGVSNTGSISPRDAANAAKAAGVRIYTIGIGADSANATEDVFAPDAGVDVDTLKYVANETGGQFYRATDGDQLADAYRAIDALEPMPRPDQALRLRHELFRVPLLAAAFCVLLGLLWPRWRGAPA
jgi:Ca-activated chloride channel homolog